MREQNLQVFICYRRDDAAYAATAIYEKLQEEMPESEVFFDVKTIPPGKDFRTYLEDAVSRCDVLLAIIGKDWVDLSFEEGPLKGRPRLSDPNDYVRIEITSALRRGIPVIPVLVGGASMPDAEYLPEDLCELAPKQAVEVRSGRDFSAHVSELAAAVQRGWEQQGSEQHNRTYSRTRAKIFISYSTRDAAVANSVSDTLRAVGFIPLQDLKELQTGRQWQDQVSSLIEEADMFVLLWSRDAQESSYLEAEWRYALSLHREDFIRPVYFEQPLPSPPVELAHLHFSWLRGLT